jgi:hypothetical protein
VRGRRVLDRRLDVRHTAVVLAVAPPVALLAGVLFVLAALSFTPALFLIGASS